MKMVKKDKKTVYIMFLDLPVTKLFSIRLSWLTKQYGREARNIFNWYNYCFEKVQS